MRGSQSRGVVETLDHSLRSSPLARLYRSQRLCAFSHSRASLSSISRRLGSLFRPAACMHSLPWFSNNSIFLVSSGIGVFP